MILRALRLEHAAAVAHWNHYAWAAPCCNWAASSASSRHGRYEKIPAAYRGNLARKLGLAGYQNGDDTLIDGWWRLLHTQSADFTLSFRALAGAAADSDAFVARFPEREPARAWVDQYLARLARDGRPDAERVAQMNGANPLYVLRNYLAENAIRAAARGDATEIDTLLRLLREPYTERAGYEAYAAEPPQWAGMLEVSCSS